MNSVAFERGFFWQTLWDHPNNARLKQTRKDPDVLLEGDILHIPDKREKQESAATRRHHRFRKRGTPAKLRLVLLRPKKPGKKSTPQAAPKWWEYHQPAVEQAQTEPDSDVPYCLYADGLIVKQGKTDQDGKIRGRSLAGSQAGPPGAAPWHAPGADTGTQFPPHGSDRRPSGGCQATEQPWLCVPGWFVGTLAGN